MKKPILICVALASASASCSPADDSDGATAEFGSTQLAQATGFAGQNGGTDGGGNIAPHPDIARSGAQLHELLCSRAAPDTPIVIRVEGTINHANTSPNSGRGCDGTAGDKIVLKRVENVTLVGVGTGATFDQLGIQISRSRNILVQNITVQNVKKSGSPTSNLGDAIGVEAGSSNIWIDHVTLKASGGESEGYDGLFDVKGDSKFVTLSYSVLEGSERGGLVGSGDSDLSNGPITWHHNVFRNLKSRVPLLRGTIGHIYNNWYDGISASGINSRNGGRALVENNYFEKAKDPLGTFYDTRPGTWEVNGNYFAPTVTWGSRDEENNPAGPNVQSTDEISVPYSVSLDSASCLPSLLAEISGANKGLRRSDGSCSAGSGGDSDGGGSDGGGGDVPGESSNVYDEATALLSSAQIDSNHAGYRGSGFINFDNNSTSSVEWNVNRSSAAETTLTVRYANGATTSRPMSVVVNGGSPVSIDFPPTGGWASWESVSLGLGDLPSGESTVALISANPQGGPNVDQIELSAASSDAVFDETTASLSAAIVASNHEGFTGPGFIDYDFTAASYSEWTVGRAVTGSASLTVRYANGSAASRPMNVIVNGGAPIRIDLPATGSWSTWSTRTVSLSGLLAGSNTIRLASTTSSGGPNVDKITLSDDAASDDGASDEPSGGSAPNGANLSRGAGADGSSKGSGTSYGNVTDGDLSTFWSPSGTTGRVSVKWPSRQTVSAVVIREFAGASGRVRNWRLTDNDSGDVVASGNGISGTIGFDSVSTSKLNFEIESASGTPQIAEFETYSSGGSSTGGGSSGGTGDSSSGGDSTDGTGGSSSGGGSTGGSGGGSGSTDGSQSGGLSSACVDLLSNRNTNWDETTMSEQEVVRCLADSLGRPVGYGENATGGYNPSGRSELVVIQRGGSVSPEQQLAQAVARDDHVWIVFDKDDFASDSELALYRNQCGQSSVRSALGGASEAQCRDFRSWCSANGISSSNCAAEFFNRRLNDKDLPIRNVVVGANTTIDGRGANPKFLFNGFAVGSDSAGAPTRTSNNVIFTHLSFDGAGHIEDHGLDPDMLRVTGASRDVWIHKNTFSRTGDAAFDVKVGAYDITVSFNRLVDVLRASLHGSSDGRTINSQITTTMHNNLFITTDAFYDNGRRTMRRVPLLRRGTSHHFNNVFVNYWKDIASVRVGGTLLWENNLFVGLGAVQAERSNPADALALWATELTTDTVQDGSFSIADTFAQFADENCVLNAQRRSAVTAGANGRAGDLSSDYSSASRSVIRQNRLSAEQVLLDYVNRVAGANAVVPYVSPMGLPISEVVRLSAPSCKQ